VDPDKVSESGKKEKNIFESWMASLEALRLLLEL
jgi:hypothetical protein